MIAWPAMRRARDLAFAAAGLGTVVFLFWRYGFTDVAAALRHAAPAELLVYLVLAAAVIVGSSLRWWLVARALGSAAALSRFIAARLAGEGVGLLVPSAKLAGDPVRLALVYRERAGLSRAGAAVAIDRLLETLSNSLCAVTYVTVFALTRAAGPSRDQLMDLLFVLVLLVGVLAMLPVMLWFGVRPLAFLYHPRVRHRLPAWRSGIEAVREAEGYLMVFIREHPAAFAGGFFGSLAIEGVIIAEYHFLLAAFALRLDLPTLLMAIIASGLSRAVPTPAALGALEASQVAVLAAGAGRPDVGFVVGVVMRLHETLWIAIGLVVLSLQPAVWRPRLLSETVGRSNRIARKR